MLATSAPVNISPLGVTISGNQLVVRYQLAKVAKPIIVGYEQGRCYLLKEYGRVIYALNQDIERLLCLVYYGLDLSKVDMNARGLVEAGGVLNHFGQERLAGAGAPLVHDFLDPSLTAVIPARPYIFIAQPSVQIIGLEFDGQPQAGLPLIAGTESR